MELALAFVSVLFYYALASNSVIAEQNDVRLSFLSWNVNGVNKFRHLPGEIRFTRTHDVVFLQETFSAEDQDLLELNGFYSHHIRARPSIRGRNLWGLTTMFRRDGFLNGTLES